LVAAGTLRPKLRAAKAAGWSEWIRTEHDERAVLAGCRFSLEHAEHVKQFFERWLRHSKGEWGDKPFKLLEWQWTDLVAPVFGWLRKDGYRRIRKVYCEIPKKNGKSTFGSGVGLYLLVADGEAGAEVYSAATKRDQANIVHGEAINMVRRSPALTKRLRIHEATKVITYRETQSKYTSLAADSAGSEGLNIHGLIVDELHAWTDRSFWDSLRYGFAARKQPLTFVITTAGVYDKTSLGWQEHEYATRWLANETGFEDEEFYGYIRGAELEDDIQDPEVHRRANPSYGVVIDPREIAKAAADAANKPTELNTFKRYRLNIWTDSFQSWLRLDQWDACQREIDLETYKGRRCYIGVDLASTRDMTAVCAAFPEMEDGQLVCDLAFWYWAPSGGLADRDANERAKYQHWRDSGALIVTPGLTTDYRAVRAKLCDMATKFNVVEVAYDPWNATQLANELDDDGFEMIQFRQGFASMNEPSKLLESMLADGTLRHDGNPITRWMAGNVTTKTDEHNNIKPNKKTSTGKIDGIVAAVMALGRAMQGEGQSIYATEKPIFV